jgi:hypothetical protein
MPVSRWSYDAKRSIAIRLFRVLLLLGMCSQQRMFYLPVLPIMLCNTRPTSEIIVRCEEEGWQSTFRQQTDAIG